jgi:hypothetical protein
MPRIRCRYPCLSRTVGLRSRSSQRNVGAARPVDCASAGGKSMTCTSIRCI